MQKIIFLMVMCILLVAGKINAQQQVSEIEARNAAINTRWLQVWKGKCVMQSLTSICNNEARPAKP